MKNKYNKLKMVRLSFLSASLIMATVLTVVPDFEVSGLGNKSSNFNDKLKITGIDTGKIGHTNQRGWKPHLNEYCYRPIYGKHQQLPDIMNKQESSHQDSTGMQAIPNKSQFKAFEVVGNDPDSKLSSICRQMLVGPWKNRPEEYEGYNGFVGWPCVTRLKSGRWIIAFTSGSWHASFPWTDTIRDFIRKEKPEIHEKILSYNKMGRPDIRSPRGGRAHVMYSDDQGKTWSRPATLIDTPLDDRHPSITELDDGTLLCMFFTYGWLPEEAGVSAGAMWMRSSDGGKTWSKPMSPPGNSNGFGAGPMIQLADQSVIWLTEGHDDRWTDRNLIFVYRSVDHGQSFKRSATIVTDHDLYEPTVAQLPDGRLVMMIRENGDICWSDDGGQSWTDPVSIGVKLFDPHLLMLPNGVLACFHGSYTMKKLRVILSPDGGQTWNGPGDGYGYSIDPKVYGYSHPMLLPDGSVYLVYNHSGGHRSADARTQALWGLRVRIHDDAAGIDILPAPGIITEKEEKTNEFQDNDSDGGGNPELGKQF